ncbi:MAG: ABC transporter substrate-binding protein, partial [Eubacteriales bacterium]
LLDPKLNNYRASDYYQGTFTIANGANYFFQGTTNYADTMGEYAFEDLVKGDDNNYYAKDGDPIYLAIDFELDWLGGDTLKTYVEYYGDAYFSTTYWAELVAAMDENGLVPLNDDTYAKYSDVTTGNENWGETAADVPNYFVKAHVYEDNYSFDNVGIFASDEYQITLVFGKSLSGFNLLYNLSSNWIVYEPYYEAGKTQVEGTEAWTSTYCTSVDTTMSYGPYKLTSYQADKAMTFERNDKWYGYTDGKHVFVDTENPDRLYPMYQTTKIETQVVAEAADRKLMFLKGQLMGYGLQAEDFDEYRSSDYCYATPAETIFFFIFNGYVDAIKKREANESFDQSKYDLETLTLTSFRKAVAVTYDKEALCAAVSPARSGGYGLIGNSYIYDPDTGARYRDTDQAKKVLCDFYSVDVSKFDSLDDAVDSITGYDPVAAKALYKQAFDEALAAGYITDTDGDGKCDQMIKIEYASSEHSAFIEKTLNYLNEKMAEVLVGTPFEGKIQFVESAPLGDAWSTNIKNGLSDTVLGGWSGSALDPFSITDCYTNPSRQYDAKWFDSSKVSLTITIDGKELTTSLKNWSEALNGDTIVIDDVEYNFGDGMVDVSTRLDILAAIEGAVLQTYDYIPMLQNASMSLLSQQVYYVVEEYNPVMGRGGITYLRYNYNESDWAAYVASQEDGQLSY